MKKAIFVLLAFIFFALFVGKDYGKSEADYQRYNTTRGTGVLEPLYEISAVMKKNEIEINKWSVYAREDGLQLDNYEQYLDNLKKLKKQAPDFTWEQTKSNDKFTAIGTFFNQKTAIKEQIKLVAYPHNNSYKTYLIYHISGKNWDPALWHDFEENFHLKIGKLFDKNPLIFSCISGQTSDIMEGVLYNQAQKLLREFSAKPIEELQEESFVSVSAYNENWKNNIPLKSKEMNIQIALRNQGLDGSTTVVIGTPIITSEY